jgi:LacI family transcriptional regulator
MDMRNGRKRAGLKDVANLAGISIASVSRVLSEKGYSSKELRQKVMDAVKQLNYRPNLQARGLRKQSSHSIGLLIPNLLNAYYTAVADTVSQLLTSHGYQLLLSSTRDDPAIEQETLDKIIGHDVAGMIWVPTVGDHQRIQYLHDQNIPVVSIVRKVDDNLIDTIVFEDMAGSRAAIQHLIQLGHRKIGYIGGDIRYSSNYDRWQGYLAAIGEAGIEEEKDYIKLGTVRKTWGAIASSELLNLPTPPTALFVASNAIVPGVMKTLRQTALRIPEDISLMCFDDLDWFSYSDPPISAVATSHEMLAEAAVDLLRRRIEEPNALDTTPAFLQLSFQLMIRRSTASPRQPAS